MVSQLPPPTSPPKNFWSPLLGGTFTALFLFILVLYFNVANVFICIFFIPFSAGFITLWLAAPTIQADFISRLFLPWAALIITLPLAYWKLKILILITFPIASLGGWLAGKLMTLFHRHDA